MPALPSADGKISAAQVRDAVTAHREDFSREHMVQPGMVYISFPTEKGTLYSLRELQDISRSCHDAGIPLFVDGARIAYGLMSPACDVSLPQLAALADVCYLGGTKQGALFGEAVVFNPDASPVAAGLSRDFRYHIKQNGGMLAKGRLLGIQFETLLQDDLYWRAARHALRQAARLREAFAQRGYPFLADSPTNQQFPILPNDLIARLRRNFSFEDWQKMDPEHTAVRFVTSWATSDEAVDALIAAL